MTLPHKRLFIPRRRMLAAVAGLVVAFSLPAPATVVAAPGCTKFASPTGSDAAGGSEAAPYRSAQKLADSLSPGDTGCLRAGTYTEDVSIRRGGQPGAPVTLRSFPGERAEVVGIFYVARTAPYVTVEGLHLNGRNPEGQPSPQVNAADTVFRDNDVTNDGTGICFILGEQEYGRAIRTLIEQNRIHDCGRLPSTNFDHGIYVAAADDVRIIGNWIYDNADWGVHLYPDAQRTVVEGNVIDGNGKGVIFSGEGGVASNDNLVQGNVITNAKLRWNVESYYEPGEAVGQGNVVRRNCISGGVRDNGNGGIDEPTVGFAVEDTVTADPQFVDRAAKSFDLKPESPCRDFTPLALPDEPGDSTRAERQEPVRLTVRLSAPGRRYVAALGHVEGSGSGTVKLTAFYAQPGKGFKKVRSRAAAVRGGRFKQRLAPFRRGRWRLEGRLKGTPSAVDARRARLEDGGAGGGGDGEAPPIVADDGRRALTDGGGERIGEESSGAASGDGAAFLGTAQFGGLEPPGPLPGGRYVAVGSPARPALVRRIQSGLSRAGFPTSSDGVFGPDAESAVERFQQSHGLLVDGVVGRQTLGALDEYL